MQNRVQYVYEFETSSWIKPPEGGILNKVTDSELLTLQKGVGGLWLQSVVGQPSNEVLILFQTSASNRSVATIESALRVEHSFLHLRRSNYRPRKLACWPYFHWYFFWKHRRRWRPSAVMIAETISSACFVLLVVGFCCMIKIFTIVKNIRPSRYERVLVVYARDNERPLSAERELTVYFPQAERGAGQRGTCNNTTYSGSQAIRRQPQMHDERFGWQSKKNIPYVSVQLENHFFYLHSLQPFKLWLDVILC